MLILLIYHQLNVIELPQGRLESMEKEVRGIDDRLNQLSKNYIDLIELKHLLKKTDSFFDEVDRRFVVDFINMIVCEKP